jgi:hypothetical protein
MARGRKLFYISPEKVSLHVSFAGNDMAIGEM